jgi:hypothetical protein
MTAEELESGYHWAYQEFYKWSNILDASLRHDTLKHSLKHFLYSGGWKKFEPLWNLVIKTKNLAHMLPLLESILSKVKGNVAHNSPQSSTQPTPSMTAGSLEFVDQPVQKQEPIKLITAPARNGHATARTNDPVTRRPARTNRRASSVS